jgi:hypothetical protein
MAIEVRQLRPGDDLQLSAFLESRADSSMFLRNNLRRSGLEDTGLAYSGTYVAALEKGRIEAVAALYWSGTLMVQAPYHLGPILQLLTRLDTRPVRGILGPLPQTDEARQLLGMTRTPVLKASREDLFALGLDRIEMPEPLAEGRWTSRRPRRSELAGLVDWRVLSVTETGAAAQPDERTRADAEEVICNLDRDGALWVLEVDGRIVSMNSYNATMPDMVQIGGVFTPTGLRGLGFARACVAGSLVSARHAGVKRSVLFTPKENASAQAAYRAIGFRVVGDYGIVMFE